MQLYSFFAAGVILRLGMRKALMIVAVAGCLMAQRTPARPAEESYDIRIARLETIVPQMQKQLDEINTHLKEIDKNLGDVRNQLTELRTDMNLVMWIGGTVSVALLGAVLKLILDKPAALPVAAAPAPVYPPPVVYSPYPPPPVDIEALVKKLLAEERARNQPVATP
jgi:hypothetical protein